MATSPVYIGDTDRLIKIELQELKPLTTKGQQDTTSAENRGGVFITGDVAPSWHDGPSIEQFGPAPHPGSDAAHIRHRTGNKTSR